MDLMKEWAGLLGSLVSLATAVYVVLTSSAKKALDQIEESAKERKLVDAATVARFQLVEQRMITLEADVEHLPEREQVHRLELAVERLAGRIETLDERLKPVSAIASRLQDLEFERAR